MEVRANAKYVKVSPLKARQIVGTIRGKNASEASIILKHLPQKSAGLLNKVLVSAMANAENNHNLDKNELVVTEAYVDNGPRYKRVQPRARGSAYPILRKTSHITIVVSGEKESRKIKKPIVKEENIEIKKVEVAKEAAEEKIPKKAVAVEDKKNEISLKDLAKDREKKETGDHEKKEEGFKSEKKKTDHEKGGFWSRHFRRKTG